MDKESVYLLVAEDLLRDFTLEEILEEMNVEETEALEIVLERYLYDPNLPAFVRARVLEFEEQQYEANDEHKS